MMVTRFLAVVAVCSLSGLAGTADDKPKGDAQLVQGSWDWDPAAKQSDAQPQVLLERVVIKGDTLTFHYSLDGKKFTTPTKFTLDPKASPKEIDFTPTDKDNPNKGKAYLGLYEVKAGQLKICYRGPGSTRPKDFDDKSAGNDVTTFIVLKPSPAA
jgi:uncharacterized protein (TIGR03067 family)